MKRFKPIFAILALVLAVAAGVHFGPRYIYSYFGDLVLKPVEGGLDESRKGRARMVSKDLRARVAWSSSRTGNHEIFILEMPSMELFQLTRTKFTEYYPRFSPDGGRLVFARSQKEWVSQRDDKPWDAYILELATGKETLAARNANVPDWVDDHTIVFQRDSDLVMQKDLATGEEKLLFDGKASLIQGRIETPHLSPTDRKMLAVTGRGSWSGVCTVNLATGRLFPYSHGCQITWFPDGKRVLWVQNGGTGGNRIMWSPLEKEEPKVFMDLPGPFSHEYFPSFSDDGKWMVWCASEGGHQHDIADYEVFLWRVGAPVEETIRLTANQANDNWPDIHILP